MEREPLPLARRWLNRCIACVSSDRALVCQNVLLYRTVPNIFGKYIVSTAGKTRIGGTWVTGRYPTLWDMETSSNVFHLHHMFFVWIDSDNVHHDVYVRVCFMDEGCGFQNIYDFVGYLGPMVAIFVGKWLLAFWNMGIPCLKCEIMGCAVVDQQRHNCSSSWCGFTA